MCVGRKPAPPETPAQVPEAAQAPIAASRRERGGTDASRRRRAAGQAAGGTGVGTILTGARGVTDGGATAAKTLLGQ